LRGAGLRDDDLAAALVEVGDDGIAVEGFVGNERSERDSIDQGFDTNGIKVLPRQQDEANETAEGIGEREDLGGHAAFGAANGLALSPPFRPVRDDEP
jgi:hypothetical protein